MTRTITQIICIIFATAILASITTTTQAQMPSKEQIEKFKRLPPAEQKALAMSLGINFDDYAFMLEGGGSSPSSVIPTEKVTGDRIQQQKKIQLEKQLKDLEKGISLEEDESPETTDEDIELFGYNVFDLGGEAFAPATDIPIPSDYVLGPGDTLVIQLFGKKNQTETLSITREGNILLPDIGPITLAGLTFSQVSKKVEEIVSKQMIGVTSSVTMSELRTIRVFVLGEVQIPGSYVIGSLSTMSNAIFSSGGITKIGSLRNIQLKRSGKIVTTLDLYDLLLRGDTSDDSRLLPGDVIFVPPIGKTVGLSGDVKRPAIYELKSEKSVEDALKLAGGLLPTAYMPASRIERITQAGEKTLVNLDLSTPQGKSFKLKDADVIQIFSTLNTMRDIVKLDGHVKRPGGFAWRQNMRFTDIVSDVDELLANPDIEIGLIKREQKLTRKITTVIFSPKKAFRNPSSAENPLLHPRDSVILFNYEDDRTELLKELVSQMKLQASFEEREKTVRVDGSVRFQGEYPLADNMKAQDLIHLAGGLLEHALETRAEITRRTLDENRNNSVMHLKIDPFQENPQLVEGDSLRILKVPMWKEKETITLQGEVMHPGTYSILPGETLMDVIHRSGGLTPHAYASGAVFSRVELRELEEERLQDLKAKIESDIAATNLTESSLKPGKVDDKEAQKIIENLSKVRPLGRMVIDLPKILSEPNSFDFPLEDGDSLTIPKHKPSIMVVGEVQYPTSHFFDRKLNTMDYVERSGGTKQNADKKRIYIVKANGRVFLPKSSAWFKVKGNNLEPGDTIVVPVDTDRVDPITMWSSVTTIMYQAALGVAAIASL